MKKLAVILAGLALAASAPAFAGEDRPINVEELPAASQQFIKTHYNNARVSYATVDQAIVTRDYKVVFADGTKVEFAKNGEWTEVDTRSGAVPDAVVPQQIRDVVAQRFPGHKIRSIERDRRGYEVKLDNGLDLDFGTNYRLNKIDD